MSDISVTVSSRGMEDVAYLIKKLGSIEMDKTVKNGLRAAGNVIRSGGQRRLRQRMKNPKGVTGNLLRSFRVRVKRKKPGVLVGFNSVSDTSGRMDNTGKKLRKNTGYHAHLLDRGTANRYQRRTNKFVGKVNANRFWQDTYEQDYNKAMDKIYDGVSRAIERIKTRQG